MTIAELIERLQKFDPTLVVYDSEGYPIIGVTDGFFENGPAGVCIEAEF